MAKPVLEIPLPLAQYRFYFTAESDLTLPEYAGAAWSGLLGRQLKHHVCLVPDTACADCLLQRCCAYSCIFETPSLDARVLQYNPAVAHSFILSPDPQQARRVPAGSSFWLNCTLIGQSNAYLPYLIHALSSVKRHGSRAHNEHYQLQTVQQRIDLNDPRENWQLLYRSGQLLQILPPQIPDLPMLPESPITVDYLTPLRIQVQNHLMNVEHFSLEHFFSHLLQRLSLLCQFYGAAVPKISQRHLLERVSMLKPEKLQLHWHHWTRYSSRKKTTLKLGGVLGQMTLNLSVAPELWPYLYYGQWVHAGKGCITGFGRYRVTSAL